MSRRPIAKAPPGVCDTHCHVYGAAARYPTADGAPTPDSAGLADYCRSVMEPLGIERLVIVQPTTYGTDNRCTADAIAAMGASARGVAILDEHTSDATLGELSAAGFRGLRAHMLPGGMLGWKALDRMAARVAEVGWHVQLQLDGRTLPDREEQLLRLPGTLVIDHIGRFMEPLAIDHPAPRSLRRLVDRGAWVKLSAPYHSSRSGPPGYEDLGPLVRTLLEAAPDRMLWASNWPHPSLGAEERPDSGSLLDSFYGWVQDEGTRRAILVENPARLYGFGKTAAG